MARMARIVRRTMTMTWGDYSICGTCRTEAARGTMDRRRLDHHRCHRAARRPHRGTESPPPGTKSHRGWTFWYCLAPGTHLALSSSPDDDEDDDDVVSGGGGATRRDDSRRSSDTSRHRRFDHTSASKEEVDEEEYEDVSSM
jgi:hypothetical protein